MVPVPLSAASKFLWRRQEKLTSRNSAGQPRWHYRPSPVSLHVRQVPWVFIGRLLFVSNSQLALHPYSFGCGTSCPVHPVTLPKMFSRSIVSAPSRHLLEPTGRCRSMRKSPKTKKRARANSSSWAGFRQRRSIGQGASRSPLVELCRCSNTPLCPLSFSNLSSRSSLPPPPASPRPALPRSRPSATASSSSLRSSPRRRPAVCSCLRPTT